MVSRLLPRIAVVILLLPRETLGQLLSPHPRSPGGRGRGWATRNARAAAAKKNSGGRSPPPDHRARHSTLAALQLLRLLPRDRCVCEIVYVARAAPRWLLCWVKVSERNVAAAHNLHAFVSERAARHRMTGALSRFIKTCSKTRTAGAPAPAFAASGACPFTAAVPDRVPTARASFVIPAGVVVRCRDGAAQLRARHRSRGRHRRSVGSLPRGARLRANAAGPARAGPGGGSGGAAAQARRRRRGPNGAAGRDGRDRAGCRVCRARGCVRRARRGVPQRGHRGTGRRA
mmetsp:Transcript_15713/g.46369  ORF Transcript_15713/g.46369 Transcript_15713/m.46369 type:complete len:288 (+) Transcript_15713:591-1454(+)